MFVSTAECPFDTEILQWSLCIAAIVPDLPLTIVVRVYFGKVADVGLDPPITVCSGIGDRPGVAVATM